MDETGFEDEEENLNINKKYAYFIIDASDSMLESIKEEEAPFRKALRLVFDELVDVCCQGSKNNQIGIIFANTLEANDDLENCYVFMPMGIPDQDVVNDLKKLIDEEDTKSVIRKLTKGWQEADLSAILGFCKRQLSQFSNTRHQTVVYMTNDRNPFGREDYWESAYFKRTKRAVEKIIGRGNRKTLGEFCVILMEDEVKVHMMEEQLHAEPWYQLDSDVFSKEVDVKHRIKQKSEPKRANACVPLRIGTDMAIDVAIYSLISEAKPLKQSGLYLKSTEKPVEQSTEFVNKDNQVIERQETRLAIEVGGETILLTHEEYERMSGRIGDRRGIDMIGFKPIDSIDLETSIAAPKFIRPNESTVIGSTRFYRALLDCCVEKRMAMLCNYQSRSNEKKRLVALIPWKGASEESTEDVKPSMTQLMNTKYFHDGFHVFFLPFKEEIREDKLSGPINEKWPVVNSDEIEVAKNFVKRLTMSYHPKFYENPRLLSEKAALCERAIGEKIIESIDTIQPYFKHADRLMRATNQIEELVGTFQLNLEDVKGSTSKRKVKEESDSSGSKKIKDELTDPATIKQLLLDGKASKMTKPQIEKIIRQFGGEVRKNEKKDEMIVKLEQIMDKIY